MKWCGVKKATVLAHASLKKKKFNKFDSCLFHGQFLSFMNPHTKSNVMFSMHGRDMSVKLKGVDLFE